MSGTWRETRRNGPEAMGEGSFGGLRPVESCLAVTLVRSSGEGSFDDLVKGFPMVRRSILAMFAVMAIVLGGVVVSTPAGAVVDTAVIVPSPNVGTNGNELYSVSCVSVSFCVATGSYSNGNENRTLVEHWDGVSWTVVSSPNVGTSFNVLYSVSCVSVSFCVATGAYDGVLPVQTLVQHWDGVSWTVVSSPNDGTTSLLYSVSCVSATECVAVGFTNTGNANQTLVVSLTGPELAPSDQVSPAFTG